MWRKILQEGKRKQQLTISNTGKYIMLMLDIIVAHMPAIMLCMFTYTPIVIYILMCFGSGCLCVCIHVFAMCKMCVGVFMHVC